MSWSEALDLVVVISSIMIGLMELSRIARALEGIRAALGDPKPGSDFYGGGGFQTLAKAIRDADRRPR